MGHYKKQSECGSYNYLLYLPEGYEESEQESWPMIMFLHGADRKGVDLDALRSSGVARLCEERLLAKCDMVDFSFGKSCEEISGPLSQHSTVDIDIDDFEEEDSPRTATAGLLMQKAEALAQRPSHRRTPSLDAATGFVSMPRMQSFPFVVVSPICPLFKYWRVEQLASLLEEVSEQYNVDRRRIYAVGEGMGGWAVCALASRLPRCLAACVPIGAATGPNFVDVNQLKETPMWIFHGCNGRETVIDAANDSEIDEPEPNNHSSPQGSDEGLRASLSLVHALKQQGARSVLFTTYPTVAAFSTKSNADTLLGVTSCGDACAVDDGNEQAKRSYTYDNPLLYQWLLQHSLPLFDV